MSNDGDAVGAKDRTVGGRYRLLERIGSGGMGTVWRAHDELVDREVAVKEPRLPGEPGDEAHRRAAHRLYREARAAARVDHPSAVSIYDVVVEDAQLDAVGDGLPWIVMELIRGESLHEVLGRGPLDPAESARIGLAVLGALRAAHAVGIVHRDVKPANVLLGAHGRVILTDFGIAHIQGEEPLTATGEFIGSLDFIAPERMSGRGAGPASDLWSLGVLLHTTTEGRPPFRRATPESTLTAILTETPPTPENAGPLTPLILRLLSRTPEQRPEADEVAAVLEAVAEGRGAVSSAVGAVAAVPEAGPGLPAGPEAVRAADPAAAPLPAAAVTAVPDPAPAPPATSESVSAAASDPGLSPAAVPGRPEAAPVSVPMPSPGSAYSGGPTVSPEPPKPPAPRIPAPARLRPSGLRPLSLALLAALLVGGVWAVEVEWGESDRGAITEWTGRYTAAPEPTGFPSPSDWVAHDEAAMDAVLSVPFGYEASARQGGADAQPRRAVYSDGPIDVRLTQWDKAPAAPMARAAEAHETWTGHDRDARTQTTRTSFHGYEAALADTTYGLDKTPTRVMQLFVRTDDGRMYELRVDMPKGTPREKQGTSVFKGARDRLKIESP
ncbi:protein kinase [Streptomyces sp. NPDC049687]|uniref:serine/threonine-protein kinase n=1 Tax=Streptomyces sp. NPDC049687 TaxID=3365596 RepID=UPI0037A833BE